MGRRSRVSTPVVAVREEPPAFRALGAFAAAWATFHEKHRDISVSVGASAVVHLVLLIIVGTSMYEPGNDDRNVPELSVQLETRAGPSSEEFTDAALPKPAPEPVQAVVDDPGTADTTVASDTIATSTPMPEQVPDVVPDEVPLHEEA